MERELNSRGFPSHKWHIRMPKIARYLSVIVLIAGLLFVGISYYRSRKNRPFRLHPGSPQLSTQVVGILEGYERRETKGDREWLLLRAARDITYSDGHHELENSYLEVYRKDSDKPDTIKASRSITDDQNNRIWFYGNVNMQTHDGLGVQTEELSYDRQGNIGETEKPLKFERENVSGHAATAQYDGKEKSFILNGNVEINVIPRKPEKSSSAEWKESTRSRPVKITSPAANFDQNLMVITFNNGAAVEQEQDTISGDTLIAYLDEQKKVKQIATRGKSYMRTMEEGHAAELSATDADFFFDADQRLQQATAMTAVYARSLNADSDVTINNTDLLKITFQAENDRSIIKEMTADGHPPEGRTVITMSAPKSHANDSHASSKKLTANKVRLVWHSNGVDLEHAEAIGNAELIVEPAVSTPTSERRILTGPRFDIEFFEAGNLAQRFTAIDNPKLTLEPLAPTPKHQTKTLNAQKMTSLFIKETQEIERVDCVGQVKYNEADRNAQSETAVYTGTDGLLKLRGGPPPNGLPIIWDARARTTATEIDSDTLNDISYARGKVATTYYSQEQTNGATPFSKVKSPVFIVSDRAELTHNTNVAVYIGRARAWQDDNFLRADRITLRGEEKTMQGDGSVQSMLYRTQQKDAKTGQASVVPVFATSEQINYRDVDKLLHYEKNVDMKQGTDRLLSQSADIYLRSTEQGNYEIDHFIAQRDVVVTQPGRRGTGNWALYTAANETVVLTGNPAHVEDVEEGTSIGKRVTLYRNENRVVSDDPSGEQATGRITTTHKVKKQE